MATLQRRNVLQLVVKISKYCNLRCNYCYEYLELGIKQKMSLEQIGRMFANVAQHAGDNGLQAVSFVWHGGEPLLVPIEYYKQIAAIQQGTFEGTLKPLNSVQSNLTVLTDRHVEFLKSGAMFTGIGISFDVYGNQRVDTRGQLRTDEVLKNMQTLIDEGIPFGAIAVLARDTVEHVEQIYRFNDQLGVQSRFLPFYMSATNEQVARHALSFDEVTSALKLVFDSWMSSPTATPVDPIDEYLDYAISYLSGEPRGTYDKAAQETVFIVDLDGCVWGVSEAYDPAYRYGNIFEQSMDQILGSPARERACHESAERIERNCRGCPYFGHCPGYFAGDATAEQQQLLAQAGCPVRNVLDHVVTRIQDSGVGKDVLAAGGRKTINEALEVAL